MDVLSVTRAAGGNEDLDSLVFDPRTTKSVAAGGCVWSTELPEVAG
jgi:hypothetical protein